MASVVANHDWRPPASVLQTVGRWILILGAIYLLLCAIAFGCLAGGFFATRPEVAVPSVIGRSQRDALHLLRTQGLVPRVVDGERSDLFPTDAIMRQTLIPGSHVREGRIIHLIRCSGPAHVTVPEVHGLDSADAIEKLSEAGLQPSTASNIPSDRVPFDAVIEQLPAPGSRVEADSIVALVISDGPPTDGTSVDSQPSPHPTAHPHAADKSPDSGAPEASASANSGAPDDTTAGDNTANDMASQTPSSSSSTSDTSAAVVTNSEPGPDTTPPPANPTAASSTPAAQ